ncbi:MAG: thiamine phosphate synthase [Pseudomonadales bacterium]
MNEIYPISVNEKALSVPCNTLLSQLIADHNKHITHYAITAQHARATTLTVITHTEDARELACESPHITLIDESCTIDVATLAHIVQHSDLCFLSRAHSQILTVNEVELASRKASLAIYDRQRQTIEYKGPQGTAILDLRRNYRADNKHSEALEPRLFAQYCSAFSALGKRPCDCVVLACAALAQSSPAWPVNLNNYPLLQSDIYHQDNQAFAQIDTLSLGLYPVVDSLEWLEKLMQLGVKTLQLRVKNTPPQALENMIQAACELGRKYQSRLFINDYWQLAIKYQAYGVHLGQEDLSDSQLNEIQQAGLHLGLSTHSEYEWLRAMAVQPSYIAMGTVFPTQTKPAIEIGLANLHRWSLTLASAIPLVAIGGIKLGNIKAVADSGVGSIAVVTAITEASDYTEAVCALQQWQNPQRSHA